MAQRICRPLVGLLDKQVVDVKVPSGSTYYPGQVVMAEVLDTNITDNLEVYAPTPLSDYTTEVPVILINSGYETLPDGRRPSGNPDFSTYSWANEDVIIGVRLEKNLKFAISDDCIDGGVTIATGVYFIPQNSDLNLTASATVGSSATALKVETTTTTGSGGQNGMSFIPTNYVRVTDGQ